MSKITGRVILFRNERDSHFVLSAMVWPKNTTIELGYRAEKPNEDLKFLVSEFDDVA